MNAPRKSLLGFAGHVILSLSLPILSNGQGNLVFNGGFDVDASGWTLTNGAAYAGPQKGNPGGWVELNYQPPSPVTPDPTASQLINGLDLGQTYIVSGNFEKTIDWSGGTIHGFSFGVAINGDVLFESADPGNFQWHSFSFLYTATSSSVVLSLAAQINGTEVSYGIDNIAMQPVPEPSLSWLILSGSWVFFYVRPRVARV